YHRQDKVGPGIGEPGGEPCSTKFYDLPSRRQHLEKRLTPRPKKPGRRFLRGIFPMAAHHKSVRCLLEIKAYPWMDYVLPGDTWKGESVAKDRRELAIQMASAANPDGTSITASHRTWLREIGMKRATLFTRLDDLKE